VCTAERVAYKNLVNSYLPPESASYCNPYREWIGAQIRADFFGYITPANPELGAEFAYRDAAISHIKNGIYGEMWVAAMLSAAASFDCDIPDVIEKIINAGLNEIPENCRLAEDIRKVIGWKKENKTYYEAIEAIHTQYNEHFSHHWCHTNSNAMIVAAALLYGELDLEKTIGYAVMGAFDTDCNGATAGSVLGMLLGAKKLPQKWIDPLCDTIISGVDGFGKVKISFLADETMKHMVI
ncbi:MAG: ADP-ribosylglycohydrolase family protein, partial [Oscillospiraceae bacterium]|nr:ADP-ribosylglycohydrolase family protein [Oscillospiraceae bacterium]